MQSNRATCCILSASALFLGGMLCQAFFSPAPAQAATIQSQGSVTAVTAKIQANEDALFLVVGDSLLVYRTDVSAKKVVLLDSLKLSSDREEGAPRGGGGR